MPKGLKLTPQLIAAAVVGLLVVLVGGGLLAIHLVEGSSPPSLTAPKLVGSTVGPSPSASANAAPAPSPSPSPAPANDGAWRVAPGSVAGYRVQETLLGQGNTAVGRTSAISGSLTVSNNVLTNATFSVDMATVTSDRSARDQQFRTRIMDTAAYPTSQFVLTQPVSLGGLGDQASLTVAGNLTLRGLTKPVTVPVTLTRTAGGVNVTGSLQITFADWSIPNPTNSIAQTGNQGILEFSVNFTHG